MVKVLLCSEDTIKTNSALNDNLFGKYLLPAIREAQDINLQQILGTTIYKKLLALVASGDIALDENVAYKTLLDDYIQDYLLYQIQANNVPYINIKSGNIGTVVASDEYIQTLSQGNIDLIQSNLQHKADYYCRRMQEFLLNNASEFDLDECACGKIEENLNSAASTGLFLGGFRAYKIN